MIGGVSGSDTTNSNSKLNMPLGVPSDIWSPESLEGDVSGVINFGFSMRGEETYGGGVGEDCNYEGDDVNGIC